MEAFVLEPEFLDLILDDNTILEKDPLEKACKLGQLMAYQYEGFGNAWILKEIRIY